MPKELKEFFKGNIDGIIVGILVTVVGGLIIAGILKYFPKFFKWLRRFLLNHKKKVSIKFKRLKKWIVYKRTIGKLVRLEIRVIPKGFLDGKSREKNPELKKVYRMIDEGLLTFPPLTEQEKLAKFFKDNPIEFDMDSLKAKMTNIKLPVTKPPDLRR